VHESIPTGDPKINIRRGGAGHGFTNQTRVLKYSKVQTFSVSILGCRVNHYEAEQIAQVLRSWGLQQVEQGGDIRVVHTCSVTSQAAKGSRQQIRRATRLNVLQPIQVSGSSLEDHLDGRAKVIVTGCWATSDRSTAEQIPGVDAVITHHEDVHQRLCELLERWSGKNPVRRASNRVGTTSLPLLHDPQSAHQRAFIKVQDGCDAHCTYCIIPRLRPRLWSKNIEDTVHEAQALVNSGHKEIVLTGIFLGAYGQPTALRRRQPESTSKPLSRLIETLCTRVNGLERLRLSSMEPGDLDKHLINVIKRYPQVVPHFHLPLQAGSDRVLRKMNRQYTQSDFLDMISMVKESFDRPALTTDIICGFPGETETDFEQTLHVVDQTGFIHIHAFPYSPRPQTAAARWQREFVTPDVVNQRIRILQDRAQAYSLEFRKSFLDQIVTVLVERDQNRSEFRPGFRHGRTERYFEVHFETSRPVQTGALVPIRVESITPGRTYGRVLE
jgi:threonylcarbamoyladenosine tRNA methylthiotransferase MtaB